MYKKLLYLNNVEKRLYISYTMKNQNKNGKKCCNNKFKVSILSKARNRRILELNSKWQIVCNRKDKKYRAWKESRFEKYFFYSILNTAIEMRFGVAANMIARGILALYNKLVVDQAKNPYVTQWQNSEEDVIVLQGFNHKHLKHLENEVKFTALGTHATYRRWYHNRVMLVLSVFARWEEIEDIFEYLPRL